MNLPRTIQILDTHTGGEPTRIIVAGGPPLGKGAMSDRRARFQSEFDQYRTALIHEPRGADVMVGAMLCPPHDSSCIQGVIFFNNVGYLGMCGHGTIGVAIALAKLGRIHPGLYNLDTPVGKVPFEFHGNGRVTLENVASKRSRKQVSVHVPELGEIQGDVAWGGNWFFLVNEHQERLTADNIERLTYVTCAIRDQLQKAGITGDDGAEIDHIELFGPPLDANNHGRNFVLCPGREYDRSPCGTGTSAKVACLWADGKLQPGDVWRQESIIGSVFESSITVKNGECFPRITGSAFVTAEATIVLDPDDPFCWGIHQ